MFLSKSDLNELELTQKQFTNSIIRAQKQMEARHFSTRKHLFEYDSVIDKQRQRIYKTRDQILHLTQDVSDTLTVTELKNNSMITEIEGFINPVVKNIVFQAFSTQTDASSLSAQLSKEFSIQASEDKIQKALTDKSLSEFLHQLFQKSFEDLLNAENPYRTLRNGIRAYLEAIDLLRVDHIDEMQNLRDKVGLYGYAQLDPLTIYKKEAFEKFEELMVQIQTQTLQRFFSSMNRPEEVILQTPSGMSINLNALNTQGADSSVQIIDADSSSSTQHDHSHSKLRPNDTISVRYQDGRLIQTKYKKVKADLES
jgi:preprotein translocase subunit SecA